MIISFLEKKQKSTKVWLLGLGLGLFAVSIVLASNLVGAAAIGAFIGELFGWTVIKTSVLGYAIIGVVGVFGLILAWSSRHSAKEPSAPSKPIGTGDQTQTPPGELAESQKTAPATYPRQGKKPELADAKLAERKQIATYRDDNREPLQLSAVAKEGVSFYSSYDFGLPEMYIHESLLIQQIREFKNSESTVLNPHTKFVEKDGEIFLRLTQTNLSDHFSDIAAAKRPGKDVDCEYKLEQFSSILLSDQNYIEINTWALNSENYNQTVSYCFQHKCFVFSFYYEGSEYLVTDNINSGEKQKYKKTGNDYYKRQGAQTLDNTAQWKQFTPSDSLRTIFNCKNDPANSNGSSGARLSLS